MTQELMTVDQSYMPALSVPQAVMRFNTLVEFVQTVMREGVDFGTIPGTPKPTLYKAGAEKLTTLFGLTVRFNIVEQVEQWDSAEPFFYYWYRCSLLRGDRLIAEADGSCNSREAKYRWREAKRVCPECNTPAIIKGKAEYGGGWLCFKKQGGCGAKYPDGDQVIEGQPTGRVLNPDICDLVNTVQKMAQKRAFVAVTLIGVNASEFFTQDIEDIGLVGDGASYVPPKQTVVHVEADYPTDPNLAAAVKKLRDCERATSGEPPKFTQTQAKDGAALAAEYAASRNRLYIWIAGKVEGIPAIEELDDQGLIDLAIATNSRFYEFD